MADDCKRANVNRPTVEELAAWLFNENKERERLRAHGAITMRIVYEDGFIRHIDVETGNKYKPVDIEKLRERG